MLYVPYSVISRNLKFANDVSFVVTMKLWHVRQEMDSSQRLSLHFIRLSLVLAARSWHRAYEPRTRHHNYVICLACAAKTSMERR